MSENKKSEAKHYMNLKKDGLLIEIKNEIDEHKCSLYMSSQDQGLVSTYSSDSIISEAGESILLTTEKSTILMNDDNIIIKIGESKIILTENDISLESKTINIKSTNKLNIESGGKLSITSTGKTEISAGTIDIEGKGSANMKSSGIASIAGSMTAVG